jgi:hypothetical protein
VERRLVGRQGWELPQRQGHLEHEPGPGNDLRDCTEDNRKVKGSSRSGSALVELEKAEVVEKRRVHCEESSTLRCAEWWLQAIIVIKGAP